LKALLIAPIVAALVGVGSYVQNSLFERPSRSQVSDPSLGMSAGDMRTLNEAHRSALIVLPVRLPSGYGWAGIGEEQGDGRHVWARSSQFTSVNGGPVIEVCAKPAAQDRGCEQDDDPYLARTIEGAQVFISISSASHDIPAAIRSFWTQVDITTSYDKVGWLKR
jgi:hypothetical protein